MCAQLRGAVVALCLTFPLVLKRAVGESDARFWGEDSNEVKPLQEVLVTDASLWKHNNLRWKVERDFDITQTAAHEDADDEEGGGWSADDTRNDHLDDGPSEPNWDLHIAQDFLDPANYKPKDGLPPCPMLNATTPMPRGTGLGGCDPGFTPAQCALHKMGIKARPMDKECFAVARQWKEDLQQLNSKAVVSDEDCDALNVRYALGINNKCCNEAWDQGCAFVAVAGAGAVDASVCRQFKPPFQGTSNECHYAEAWYKELKDSNVTWSKDPQETLTGDETAQNEDSTDYAQCTKWGNFHHLTTVVDSRRIGFRPPMLPDWHRYKGIEDPTPEIRAEEAMARSGSRAAADILIHPQLGESESLDAAIDEAESGGTHLSDAQKRLLGTTTISVITRAKKSMVCSVCLINETDYIDRYFNASQEQKYTTITPRTRQSGAADTVLSKRSPRRNVVQKVHPVTDGACKPFVSRVCRHKTVLRCEKLCFLIGYRGRMSQGVLPWKQSFSKRYCPVGSVVEQESANPNANASDSNSTMDSVSEISTNVTVRTRQDVADGQPVTLTKLIDTIKHLPPVIRKKVMGDIYDTEDPNAELCCFPGCALPSKDQYGDDNPWYWYDSQTTLQAAASTEAAHIF